MSGLHPARELIVPPNKFAMSGLRDYLVQNALLRLPTFADMQGRALANTEAVYVDETHSVYAYDASDTTSADDGHFIILDATAGTPRCYKLQGFTRSIPLVQPMAAAAVWTNQPAALNFWQATASQAIFRADLKPFRKVRLHGNLTVAGLAASTIFLRYFATYSTTTTDYAALSASEVQLVQTTTGYLTSAWFDIVAAARADVFLALMGLGGNAAADPTYASLFAEFST